MLVDTNVVSELMRARPSPRVLAWAEEQDAMTLSVVTLEEILVGLAHRPSLRMSRWFDDFVAARCELLSITPSIARRAGLLRGGLLRDGKSRTQADTFIAATAIEHNLALATRNLKDFEGCGVPLLNPFLARSP
jgi:predicted nucleic acid-binding protein